MKKALLLAAGIMLTLTSCSAANLQNSREATSSPDVSSQPTTSPLSASAPIVETPPQPATPTQLAETVIIIDAEKLRVQVGESEYDYSYMQSPEYVIEALTTVYGYAPTVGASIVNDACDYNVMQASWDGISIKYTSGSSSGFKSFWVEASKAQSSAVPSVESTLGFKAGDTTESVLETVPEAPRFTVPDTGTVRVLDEISPESTASSENDYASAVGSVLEMNENEITAIISPQWFNSPC